MEHMRLRDRRWFRIAMVLVLGYAAFYLSGAELREQSQSYYSYSLSDEGGVGWDPISLWKQTSLADLVIPPAYRSGDAFTRQVEAQRATGLGAVAAFYPTLPAPDMPEATSSAPGRQVIRNISMHLLVQDPSPAVEKIGTVAAHLGGYVLSSQVGVSHTGEHGAVISIRVPVGRLEEARARIRQLALRVDNERSEAQDVTKDFVDMQSTLRNYHAEEDQYLAIMKRASATKDVLEVSAKLSDVRGRIEKLQGELQYLSHQIAMSSITVYLDAEAQAQVLGIHWRPLYRLKVAARGALDSVGTYFSFLISLMLRLPAILLWIATLFVLASFGWRLLRWMTKLLFPLPSRTGASAAPPENTAPQA